MFLWGVRVPLAETIYALVTKRSTNPSVVVPPRASRPGTDIADNAARGDLRERGIDVQMRHSAGDGPGAVGHLHIVISSVGHLDICQDQSEAGRQWKIRGGKPPLIQNGWMGGRGGNLKRRARTQTHRLVGRLPTDGWLSVIVCGSNEHRACKVNVCLDFHLVLGSHGLQVVGLSR
jgi:hypothetical protein